MIKKISTQQLQVGMYVHDLDADWMAHNFLRNRFPVKNEKIVDKILKSGIKHIYIDTSMGSDLDDAPTAEEVMRDVETETVQVAETHDGMEKQVSVAEEFEHARTVYKEAHNVMRNLMEDIRLGKQVEVEAVEPIAEKMIGSIFRNKDALISLSRIKNKDEYTFMHSVGVAGLMITFARAVGLDADTIHQVAVGGLLHDIGKMMVPDEILNKPGRLTEEEFKIMKTHVVHSREILSTKAGITPAALDVAAQHHERIDGTGYPLGLKGDEISTVGQMSTIVDVYDALTSVRVYKNAWEPTDALKKLLEWSPSHFRVEQVHQFIRCLGIYPIGTLVELESGRVGIVFEQGEQDLLRPTVRVIYHARHKCYLPVKQLDLARHTDDRILYAVSPEKYGIDLGAFM